MNKKRLLQLAGLLDTVKPKKFDIGHFVGTKESYNKGIFRLPALKAIHNCGSTACALGWAAVTPSFRRMGFRLWDGRDIYFKDEAGEYFGLTAGAVFFDISDEETESLFGITAYDDCVSNRSEVTPKMVAKRIRGFVKDGY